MSKMSMAAPHAAEKGREPIAVFAVLKAANEAKARFGAEKVVNASIGAIMDEEENFVSLTTVNEHFRQLPAEDLMNYAPVAGLPDFQQAAIKFTFQGNQPENTYVKAIATPGGTGAVRHVFYNYLEIGKKVLIPDWCWGNYRTMANEYLRGTETYEMFDQNGNFTLTSVKEKTWELLKSQDNLVIVFNTPAHNPTGYSMTKTEWQEILDFLKNCAEDPRKKIIILVDMAYIDYAGDPQETRKFMKLFGNLPKNILITFAYSMSKSFTMYGMRSGALIGLSSSEDVMEEFYRINSVSNRGVWSNGSRGAQRLLADVYQNEHLKAKIDQERSLYSELLKKRAAIFVQEAEEVGLEILPYHTGFFITVPAQKPKAVTAKLAENNIFALHLDKGIRFAICSIPTHKVPGIALKTKEAMK